MLLFFFVEDVVVVAVEVEAVDDFGEDFVEPDEAPDFVLEAFVVEADGATLLVALLLLFFPSQLTPVFNFFIWAYLIKVLNIKSKVKANFH